MKAITIPVSEDLCQLLQPEPERVGENVSQYIRQAALARSAIAASRRPGDSDPSELPDSQGSGGAVP